MSEYEPFTCPYCQQPTQLSSSFVAHDSVTLSMPSADGHQRAHVTYRVCPNTKCRRASLRVHTVRLKAVRVGDTVTRSRVELQVDGENALLKEWLLIPSSTARTFDAPIPKAIVQDYNEASDILSRSPKAAATLARRALQGMIRDFYGISKATLFEEIAAIQTMVDPDDWRALEAVRKVGNIGAHMEKDVNVIIDVTPDEATALLTLVELLLADWYVVREKRKRAVDEVIRVADEKEAAKKAAKTPPGTP